MQLKRFLKKTVKNHEGTNVYAHHAHAARMYLRTINPKSMQLTIRSITTTLLLIASSVFTSLSQETETLYFSGKGFDTAIEWEFFCTDGRRSGEWTTIPVPSNWELHGLYDGGHGAGLEDFWRIMWDHPLSAGGFLWVFSDEGVVRTDKDGWIDTNGDHAPDGILGPYREKEGSRKTLALPLTNCSILLPPQFPSWWKTRII